MRAPLALTLALGLAFSASGVALAQSKCDAAKSKEIGKKVSCKMKVHAKALQKEEPLDLAKLAKCETKFVEKCGKAETKGDCSNAGDCATLELAVDSSVQSLRTEITLSLICTENANDPQCPFNDPCSDGTCAISGNGCSTQANCDPGEECCCHGFCI
jgi:hypothetical protein